MPSVILSINAGSSSLKCAVHDMDDAEMAVLNATVSGLADKPRLVLKQVGAPETVHEELPDTPLAAVEALRLVLAHLAGRGLLDGVCAVGHRIVHGGSEYVAVTRLDAAVLRNLERLTPLAPTHQDVNLACAEAAMAALPGVPHFGCFDTAFHHDQPRLARLYALPRELSAQGLQSYGFHGLSFAYIARRLEALIGERARGRIIIAHLGSGASLCAIRGGRSIATTMGLTPLDGLPMSTRCGALDPGVVLHLIIDRDMAPSAVSEMLLQRSGLLGVSGLSGDMRELLASQRPEAEEAVSLFAYRAGRAIGSLAGALGGLDAIVFTAGIGENAPEIRRRICEATGWLGVRLDAARNEAGELSISDPASAVEVLVVPTDEQAMIVQLTQQQLQRTGAALASDQR